MRKDEVLVDVACVAFRHESKLRWNGPESWVWSDDVVHHALVDTDTSGRAQEIMAAKGADRGTREGAAPHPLADAIDAPCRAQPDIDVDPAAAPTTARVIEECDQNSCAIAQR